jgi:LysM repeat protein
LADSHAVACPYLAADGRAWRSVSAHRDHRCTAVAPPAQLALDKQRRLCLADDHLTCATYRAAVEALPRIAGGSEPAVERVTRWSITRTTPVLVDQGRLPAAVATLSPFRRGGQVALGGLMIVALAAVLTARLTAPDDRPTGAVVPSPSPSAADTPSALPSRAPSATPVATPTPTPEPTPSPTAAPTPLTYTVKSGDTLSSIASRNGTTVSAIADLNGITDPSRLRIGQVLQIPVPAAS